MRRYLQLLHVCYRAALLTEMEYRIHFFSSVAYSLMWTVWVVGGISVFFYHRSTIGGWTYDETLIIMGLFIIFNGFIDAVLRPNIVRLTDYVQKGTLDFILLKPANSQFLATITAVSVFKAIDLFMGAGLIVLGLYRTHYLPAPRDLLLFAIMMPAGAIIAYSMWLYLATLAFWFVKVDNFTELFYAFYEVGRFPVTIYKGWIRGLLTFIVPVAFLTTFPAATLLGRLSGLYAAGSLIMSLILLFGASAFWRYAIRFYSSASS
jgi:ABC-2 type transport system permease protein